MVVHLLYARDCVRQFVTPRKEASRRKLTKQEGGVL